MTTPTSGHKLNPEEEKLQQETAEHWRRVWNETPAQTIVRLEDAAKQLITITAGLQGIYVALITFSSIRTQIATISLIFPTWGLLLFFCMPLLCWLVSLACAMGVFIPRIRSSVNFNEVSVSAWRKVKDEYGRVAEEKLRWLHWSQAWLVASFVLVLIAVVVYLLTPTPTTGPTPIIIVTPTPSFSGSPTP